MAGERRALCADLGGELRAKACRRAFEVFTRPEHRFKTRESVGHAREPSREGRGVLVRREANALGDAPAQDGADDGARAFALDGAALGPFLRRFKERRRIDRPQGESAEALLRARACALGEDGGESRRVAARPRRSLLQLEDGACVQPELRGTAHVPYADEVRRRGGSREDAPEGEVVGFGAFFERCENFLIKHLACVPRKCGVREERRREAQAQSARKERLVKGFERCGRIERDAAQSVLRGARLADPAEKSAVLAVYARQKLLNVRRFANDFAAERLPAVRTSGESASIVKGIFRISFNQPTSFPSAAKRSSSPPESVQRILPKPRLRLSPAVRRLAQASASASAWRASPPVSVISPQKTRSSASAACMLCSELSRAVPLSLSISVWKRTVVYSSRTSSGESASMRRV